MKKNALDRLIEKNEKQSKIRKTESRSALKYGFLGYFIYVAALAVGFWLTQDSVRFFDFDLWGMSKILWLIGMALLSFMTLIFFSMTLTFFPILKWLWSLKKELRTVKKWITMQSFMLIFRIIMAFALVYLMFVFTQFMRQYGYAISDYFLQWHHILYSLVFFLSTLALMTFLVFIALFLISQAVMIYRLWTDEQFFKQQLLPRPQNDDWI